MKLMPKPGAWMITFKKIMGFFMMATVLWLLWVFGAQTNTLSLTVVLGGLFFLSIACWTYGKWASPVKAKLTRIIGTTAALVLFGFGSCLIGWASLSLADEPSLIAQADSVPGAKSEMQGDWETFSPERVAELRKKESLSLSILPPNGA